MRNRDRKNELGEYTVVCMEEGYEYSGRPSGLRIHMLEEHEKRVAYVCTLQDCDFHCHWSVGCIQVHSRVETSIHRVVDKHDRHGIEVLVIGEDIDFDEEAYKGNSHSVRCVADLKGRALVTSKQSKAKYAAKVKEDRRIAKET